MEKFSTNIPLSPGKIYHVYNRANGDEKLFLNKWNYLFFLDKFRYYVSPVCHVYTYCLLPNHFHFLIRIKEEKELCKYFIIAEDSFQHNLIEYKISKQFSKLFSCYTQAFNKKYNRMGSLFMKNFKRKLVENPDYLLQLIIYIHYNPVRAKLCDKPEEWNYSSYNDIIKNNENGLVNIQELMYYFNDVNGFINCHVNPVDIDTHEENFNIP